MPTSDLLPQQTVLEDAWTQSKRSTTLANGLPLRYVELGEGERTLLLLHGFTSSSRTWALVASHLAKHFHVLIPDQRGHGDSAKPQNGYDVTQLAADAVAFLDALNLAEIDLVGVSMGSFVAQKVAAAYPERVRKLVLVSSGTTREASPGVDWLREQVEQLTTPIDEEFLSLWLDNPNPVDKPFHDAIYAETAVIPPYVWKGVMDGLAEHDPRGFLSEISAETHILFGALDAFFSADEQQELLTLIPNATLKTYPHNGHNLHWEQPESIATDIINFCQLE